MNILNHIILTIFLSFPVLAYGGVESIECTMGDGQQSKILLSGTITLGGSMYFNESTDQGENLSISQSNAYTIVVSMTAHGKTVSMQMRKDVLQLVKAGNVGSVSINEENNLYKNLAWVRCKKTIVNH